VRVRRGGVSRRASGPRGGRISNPMRRPSGPSPMGGRAGPGGALAGGLGGLGKAGGVGGILITLLVAFLALRGGTGVGPTGPAGPADGDVVGVRTELVEQDKTGRGDLTAAERMDLDEFVDLAVDDLVAYWVVAYPEVYGSPYQQLGDVFAYSPSEGAPISCGGSLRPEQLSANAIYCSDGDYITWDSDLLFPNFYANFGKAAVGVVLAHEWGHAIQFRAEVASAPITRELEWNSRTLQEMDRATGDLDEGMAALLNDPDGSDAIVFDRIAAFENGFFEGDQGTLDSVELCGG